MKKIIKLLMIITIGGCCMCLASIKTSINKKTYEKQMKQTAVLINAVHESDVLPIEGAWEVGHLGYDDRLNEYRKRIDSMASGIWMYGDTIAFGDSLMDQQNKEDLIFTALHKKMNFAVGGAWAHHIAKQAEDVALYMLRKKCYNRVKNVVVGCFGGNPLLQKQPLDITVQKTLESLDRIRKVYPTQKIIIYGIPPVVVVYATKNAFPFEDAIYKQWVLQDHNSVFLPLQKKFAGKFGIFPKTVMTCDGIHMSPEGCKIFSDLIKIAKNAKPWSIVD